MLALILAACGNKLMGKWQLVSAENMDGVMGMVNLYFVFWMCSMAVRGSDNKEDRLLTNESTLPLCLRRYGHNMLPENDNNMNKSLQSCQ